MNSGGQIRHVIRKHAGLGQADIRVTQEQPFWLPAGGPAPGTLIDCTYPENIINFNCWFASPTKGTATSPSAMDVLNTMPLTSTADVNQFNALYGPTPAAPNPSSPSPIDQISQTLGLDPTTGGYVLLAGGGLLLVLLLMAARR